MPIKELHFARNIDELMRKSEIPNFEPSKYDWNRLARICHQFKDEAKEALKEGDEERAYMMFYRFLSAIKHVKKEDKERFREKVKDSEMEVCFRALERLQGTLNKRYSEKHQQYEERKNKLFSNSSNNNNNSSSSATPLPGTSVKVVDASQTITMNGFGDEEKEDDLYATISPTALIESIQKRSSQLSKILIIDIRSAEENAESAIAANRLKVNGEVNIVNIPGELITPGLTFSSLSRKVSLGLVKDALERRRSMDTVVIMDKTTVDFDRDSKCVLLAEALFKWDQSPECVRKKPVLLKGGFSNFAITYPIYVTNSGIINHLSSSSPSPRLQQPSMLGKNLYDFEEKTNVASAKEEEEEEEKKQPISSDSASFSNKSTPTATLNGFIGSGHSNGTSSAFSNNTAISSKSFGLTTSKVPGIARPIIPDRAAKPKLPSLHNNNNTSGATTLDDLDLSEVTMRDEEEEEEKEQLSSATANNRITNHLPSSRGINIASSRKSPSPLNEPPPPSARSTLPPKPGHLVSSLTTTNGHTGLENGIRRNRANMEIDDDDDDDESDFVAGKFDDLTGANSSSSKAAAALLQTPVHRRGEVKFRMVDENMSEEEEEEEEEEAQTEEEEMEVTGGGESRRVSGGASMLIGMPTSKPISMSRSINPSGTLAAAASTNFSAPGSLSRSLSSPNIAQFDEATLHQNFSYTGSTGFGVAPGGTPKALHHHHHHHPIVDRTMKPGPIQALLRKTRDFSPQYSSYGRIPGLRNLGNTCFMNAVLQCLNNTSALAEYLRRERVHINAASKFGSNGELAVELMELIKQMSYPSNFKHISPKDLKGAVIRHIPDFVEYKQQDAHEFLVRFLDRLHADMNTKAEAMKVEDPVAKDPNFYDSLTNNVAAHRFWALHAKRHASVISDLFEGLIISTISCLHCRYTSRSLEAFTCLTVPIAEGAGRTSITTSLKMFLRQERLGGEQATWQCLMCKQKRDAEKCTYIWRLPKILVIHLKRFSYDGMWRQKITTFVDFPIDNLLIESHGQPNNELHSAYSLYGVVNHTGSLEGGHYIAYSRNLEMNLGWHKYDDQEVSPVSASEVITQNAYVLFYRQSSPGKS